MQKTPAFPLPSSPALPRKPQRPEVTDELLADITRRLVEAIRPLKIILFGSYACGTPHRDSDLDLLVVMDSEESATERYVRVAMVAKTDFVPMDLLVRTPAEIQQRLAIGDPFIKEIPDKGKTLNAR